MRRVVASRWYLMAEVVLLAVLIVLLLRSPGAMLEGAEADDLSWRQTEILVVRGVVHGCQDELRKPRRPVAQRIVTGGIAYRRWVLNDWRRDRRFFCGVVERLNANPRLAILYVFGSRGGEAIEVAVCESDYYPTDGIPDTVASNGQYLGMFQMGEWERTTYGHGSTPLRQAFAARDYFVDSGSDWSPWECKP